MNPPTRRMLDINLSTHSRGTALSGFAFVWSGQILPGHQVTPINFAVCIIFFQLSLSISHPTSYILHPASLLHSVLHPLVVFRMSTARRSRQGDEIAFSLRSKVRPRNVCSQVLHLFVRLLLCCRLFRPGYRRLFRSSVCSLAKFLHGVDGVGLQLLHSSLLIASRAGSLSFFL